MDLEKQYKNLSIIAIIFVFIIILFFAIMHISSNFSPGHISINVNVGDVDGGTVLGSGQYKKGETVTIQAFPRKNYKFKGWKIDDQVISNKKQYQFMLEEQKDITAIFEEVFTFTVKEGTIPGGTVEGGGQFKKGEDVTAQATPNPGYEFVGWKQNNEIISTNQNLELTLEGSKKIIAKFKLLDSPIENNLVITDGDYLKALVTKDTYLGRYHPEDLKQIPLEYTHNNIQLQLREEALKHLIKLFKAAEKGELNQLTVMSAYRGYNYQQRIFTNNASRHGREQANKFSAKPGQSEHQLGTAVDFSDGSGSLSQDFADTPEGKWLAKNAHKYGFIMSYPEGKANITGYIYEPWHFRYIGIETAEKFKQSDYKTLTEFLEEKPQYFEEMN
ncbi:D-alanyl-D-alanine carboxypeptidase family protein [Proteinivorax tanatarense]|uniref:D-alanyl-D-alanine carboxypeptidase family protein n=1 Tax=Proteinivorax tanatarense TaxID=1260629 RepID=A0AAU7VQ73_9FIRM